MALKKEVTFNNGVKLEYHRIGDVQLNNKTKKTEVSVISYVSEEFRNQEKDNLEKLTRHEELLDLIIKENEKEETERDTEQIISWSDEANELVGTYIEDLDLSVLKMDFSFENITDISMSNLYNLIKQDDFFLGSEDIL